MPRSFSGKDIRFSLWQQGFDSPTGYHHRSHSSVGRAPALQAGGHRFKSYCDHQFNNNSGGVAQLVRAPACHAGGREFDPRHSRHFYFLLTVNAQIAQSVEQGTENPRVGGSIPPLGTTKNI